MIFLGVRVPVLIEKLALDILFPLLFVPLYFGKKSARKSKIFFSFSLDFTN